MNPEEIAQLVRAVESTSRQPIVAWDAVARWVPLRSARELQHAYAGLLSSGAVEDGRFTLDATGALVPRAESLEVDGVFMRVVPTLPAPQPSHPPPPPVASSRRRSSKPLAVAALEHELDGAYHQKPLSDRRKRAKKVQFCDSCGAQLTAADMPCSSCEAVQLLEFKVEAKASFHAAPVEAPPPPAPHEAGLRPKVLEGDEVVVYIGRDNRALADALIHASVCTTCGATDDSAALLQCFNCAIYYHWYCAGLTQPPVDGASSSWRCPVCKVCELCLSAGAEEHVLVCDRCDRGYHTYCLRPPLSFIPLGEWLCPDHGHCLQCNGHSAGTAPDHIWHDGDTTCHPCWEWGRQGHRCPSCSRAFNPFDFSLLMVGCDCGKWVHVGCDGLNKSLYDALATPQWENAVYSCVACRAQTGAPVFASPELMELLTPHVAAPAEPEKQQPLQPVVKQEPCLASSDVCLACVCAFCTLPSQLDALGRLVPVPRTMDCWVHVGCALTAKDVVRRKLGGVTGLTEALERSRSTLCALCHAPGAASWCRARGCPTVFHLPCALRAGLACSKTGFICAPHLQAEETLRRDKPHLAPPPTPCAPPELASRKAAVFLVRLGKPPEEMAQHVRTQTHRIQSWEERLQEHVAKNPTVFLDQQYEASTRAAEVSDAAMHNVLDAVLAKATVHRGALQVVDFGLVRTSPNSFHHNRLVFPVGFVARRRFWSYVHAGATTVYTHTIAAVDDKPSFALCAADDPDHPVVGDSPVSAWDALLSRLGAIRPNPRERITGDQSWKEEMFGFTAWVVAAIEAMPGANECYAYNFQFWRRSRSASTTANVAHEYGAARFIPAQVARRAHKVVADPFAYSRAAPSGSGVRRAKGSAKRSRDHRARPVDEEDDVKALPDFVRHHQMLHHPPQLVVHKSRIHGMGVYTLTPIKRRDMVIEYQGEIIRPSVADMRERDYDKRGIPCYLWKLDDTHIVDATVKGNMARFINHCHDPNCVVDIVDVGGSLKVVVSAKRDIVAGEELTYDYMFDDSGSPGERIICDCGAVNCPGLMNAPPLF